MAKSATDVMGEIIFSSVMDAIGALKTASKGMPNTLLRDLNAIHANTTLPDLPQDLQTAISASVRAAFTRLQKEGYSVSSGQAAPPRNPPPKRDGATPPPYSGKRPPERPRPDAKNTRDGGRPTRRPKPRGA